MHTPALRHHETVANPPARARQDQPSSITRDDLEKFIAGLGATPILIGHSLGGLLAQMLAARGRPAPLVLLAPSAPWGVLPIDLVRARLGADALLVGDFWNRC